MRTSPPPPKGKGQTHVQADDSWKQGLPQLLSPQNPESKELVPHGVAQLLSPLKKIVPEKFYTDYQEHRDKLKAERMKKTQQSLHDTVRGVSSDEQTSLLTKGSTNLLFASKSTNAVVQQQKPPSSLVVVLNYGRSKRKRVQRILRQPSQSMQALSQRDSQGQRNSQSQKDSQSQSQPLRPSRRQDHGSKSQSQFAATASTGRQESPTTMAESMGASAITISQSGQTTRSTGGVQVKVHGVNPHIQDPASGSLAREPSGPAKIKPNPTTALSPLLEAELPKPSPGKRKREDAASEIVRQTKKQQRIQDSQDRIKNPQTPTNNPKLLSPASIHKRSDSSSQVHTHLTPTPVKDLKATSMTRTLSNDSITSTPLTSQPTPVPSSRAGPTSAPAMNGAHVETSHLTHMISELRTTGKRLKDIFNDINNRSSSTSKSTSVEERKRGSVAGLESLLAFVLAFAAEDALRRLQKRKANAMNWPTMRPLFDSIKRLTREFPHLSGLQHHIGVAICNRIVSTWDDRPTPSSSASEKHLNEQFSQCIRDLQNWSHEAWSKLPLDSLIDSYPKTWSKRAMGERESPVGSRSSWEQELSGIAVHIRDGSSSLQPGKFWMPLAADSGPLQCVRFASSFLQEFAEKERLAYEVSLKV
jgi:hypothetical protein